MIGREGGHALAAILRGAARSLYAEREIILRSNGSLRYIRLSRVVQAFVVVVALAGAGWFSWRSVLYVDQQLAMANQEREIASRRAAYDRLVVELTESRVRFAAITQRLEENHAELMGLLDQNAGLKNEVKGLQSRLHTSDAAQDQAQSRGADSLARVQDRLQRLERRNTGLMGELRATESKLFAALRERTEVEMERERLTEQIDTLEGRVANLQASQEGLLDRVAERTVSDIDRVQRALSQIGVDVDRLLERSGSGGLGQGGPFVAATAETTATDAGDPFVATIARLDVHMDRWQALQKVLRTLPLIAPVDQYYVASPYGKRRDPINGRWAVHEGVDLAGPHGSPVHAPAPGTVVFVGPNGRYGRMVKLNHGLGITTVYAHLSQTLVKVGQKVRYRQEIGRLGSTGRSTGTHVHYEIQMDGKPLDPFKFFKAGRDVFKG
jgi:murein DD-endopeptidase MepM/ murein hydrolase activator NlpD